VVEAALISGPSLLATGAEELQGSSSHLHTSPTHRSRSMLQVNQAICKEREFFVFKSYHLLQGKNMFLSHWE